MAKFEMKQITGVIAAMITLFDENENVDIKRTENLVDFLMEQDIDGFYLTGSTGEGFLMTGDERKLVVETVVKRVAGRKPIVVHVGDIGTKKSIDLAKHAYASGADAVCRLNKQEMTEYIHYVIQKCEGHGGFAFGSGNSIPDYVPADGYMNMVEIVREYRGDFTR